MALGALSLTSSLPLANPLDTSEVTMQSTRYPRAFNLRLPSHQHDRIRQIADERGVSMHTVLLHAVQSALDLDPEYDQSAPIASAMKQY